MLVQVGWDRGVTKIDPDVLQMTGVHQESQRLLLPVKDLEKKVNKLT